MIVLSDFRCNSCGRRYRLISKVTSDKELEYLKNQEMICDCGERLKASISEISPSDLLRVNKFIGGNRLISVARYNIGEFSPSNFRIDIGELIHIGFAGIFRITYEGSDLVCFKFLPLEHRYEVFTTDRRIKKCLKRS